MSDEFPEGYSRKTWPKHHVATSPQNRVGQSWKPGKVELEGEDVFGNKKKFMMDKGLYKCKKCNEVVRIDIRGYAHCTKCGEIHNDGFTAIPRISNRGRKKLIERFKYDVLYKVD
jgi:hypothetical protein